MAPGSAAENSFPCYFGALILLLALLFLPHSTLCSSTEASILQCLTRRSVPPNLILSPKSLNFTATLFSSAQNNRTALSKHPLLIVTPTHESQAQSSVHCCRRLNLHLRVRSGGHDYEGLSYSSTLRGPFLLLDLQLLRSIHLEPTCTAAWVQPGATLGEFYYAIAASDNTTAFPAGICPTIGIGGHISGGGIGPLMRAHGLAVDNLLDVRLLDANGDILNRASMGEDLFWALRGGGAASFGIVLAYKIRLVEVPSKVTVFIKSITLSQGATKAVSKWQQVAYKVDTRLYIHVVLQTVDDGEQNRTVQATFKALFLGEMKELLPLMEQSLPELQVAAEDCREKTWIQSLLIFNLFPPGELDGMSPSTLLDRKKRAQGISFKTKSDIVTEPIAEKSWEEIWKYMLNGKDNPNMLIEPLGGKVAEIAETATPFPHRNGSKYIIQYILAWKEAGEKVTKKHIDSSRRFYRFMAPFVSKNPRAAYLNFRDLDIGRNREGEETYSNAEVWGRKYFKANFQRLAYAKSKLDPSNFFRNEQSIPPLI